MSKFQQSIDVNVPIRMAYDQWTQFERFPRFMEGVEEVRQLDAQRLHWKAKVGGHAVEWDAEILDQVPDTLITWRSISGARNEGSVRFQPIDDARCRISLTLDVEPQTFTERFGTALGSVASRVTGDLGRFKAYVEALPQETGAWRGEIRDGVVQPPAPPV